jgi:hypothetical protein
MYSDPNLNYNKPHNQCILIPHKLYPAQVKLIMFIIRIAAVLKKDTI